MVDLQIQQGENRKCLLCNNSDIEDEFHFTRICPDFNDLRSKCLKPYYIRKLCMFKFVQLLTTENISELNSLGKYLFLAGKRRKCKLAEQQW